MNIVYLYFDVCVKYITAKKVQFNNIGVAIFDEQLGDRAAERWLCHFKKQSTLPIRLTQTPTTCRVLPFAGI